MALPYVSATIYLLEQLSSTRNSSIKPIPGYASNTAVALFAAVVLDLYRCRVMPRCRSIRSKGSLREATEGSSPPGATQPLGQGQGVGAVFVVCRGQVLYCQYTVNVYLCTSMYIQCIVNVLPVYYQCTASVLSM